MLNYECEQEKKLQVQVLYVGTLGQVHTQQTECYYIYNLIKRSCLKNAS